MVRGSPAHAEAASQLMRSLSGVSSVVSNSKTGSITVTFDDRRLCPSKIINVLAQRRYLQGIIGFPRQPNCCYLTPTDHVPHLSPLAKTALKAAARLVLPVLAERAFGKPGKWVVSALL